MAVLDAYCRGMQRLDRASIPRALDPVTVDRLMVLGLILGGFTWAWPGYLPAIQWSRVDWIAYGGPLVVALVAPLPLLARRTRPLLVFGIAIAVFALSTSLAREVPTPSFVVLLTAYSVGRYTSVRSASIAAIGLAAVLGIAAAVANEGPSIWLAFMVAVFVSIWLTGDTARTRELRSEQLEERAARLEADQRAATARAADAERARIARELHDVIAHNVTVMVVQAAAAQRVLERDPAVAKASLATIESTGREALTEMRRLLGILRAGDPGESDPQPSLASLPELVEEMRTAGLPVELAVEGTPRDLPPGVDLSAYRVVQEALTNALRHSGRTATHVLIRYLADTIELEIVDEGRRAGATRAGATRAGLTRAGLDPTAGHGLVGMRERVALVRGELEAGPRPEGGFRVLARLPVDVT
ncbi:MAG: sensor histidine kinase [Chloroflexi bacterium]|nr:sensor histidine kinase [Chloroflexota bacterium]